MSQLKLKTWLSTGVVAAALAFSGVAAQAQGPGGPMGARGGHGMGLMMPMGGGHMEHMLDLVDASDAQRAQIKQIMEAAHADLKAQHEGSRKLHEQGLALFTAPNIDAAAIESLRQQMSAQHELNSKRMSQAMVEVARVLTPEQRAKMAERMKKMQARMAKHMEMRGGWHGS